MNSLDSKPRIAVFVLSESNAQRSRENIMVTQAGAEVLSGTVLAKADNALTGSSAPTAGNTGNPTFGSIVAGVTAVPGAYDLRFTAATKFDVETPDGVKLGTGTTGVAFNKGGLAFTLTAGGTPAVAGDSFTITVGAGTGKYVPYVAAGAAGPAAGICYSFLPLDTGDVKAVGFVRDCEILRGALVGLDAAAEADLAKLGIIVRGANPANWSTDN